ESGSSLSRNSETMTRTFRRTILRKPNSKGQALVEFAFVFPVFMVLLVAVIEYGFLMNANLASSYATRDASLVAAEAGNATGSDCAILRKIEDDINGPSDPKNIANVQIYWADAVTGAAKPGFINTYVRSTSQTVSCTIGGVSFTLPYVDPVSKPYLETTRCNVIIGCAGGHPGLDTVGVQITYNYVWHTPLKGLLGFAGSGWTVVKANAMEMEPVL
ncbi:MAG TPA: TadE/TadG family type IV pilus assembly protein, partial [Candidatus Dormibacteraeota bacterium]